MAPVRVRFEGTPPVELGPEERRLREDAGSILEAALTAVEPERLVEEALAAGGMGPRGSVPGASSGSPLGVGPLGPAEEPVTILAVGKAARAMARGAVRGLGPHGIRAGLVLEPGEGVESHRGGSLSGPGGPPGHAALPERRLSADGDADAILPGFRSLRGGHPLPTEEGRRAAREMVDLALEADPGAPVLLLLSGGGSALLTAPVDGVSLEDLRATTNLLLRSGASIHEINAVRKHLEELKGGGLARALSPRPLTVLALSDVAGDRPEVIASGPASPDASTFQDALDVLRERGLLDPVPRAVRDRLTEGAEGRLPETPGPGDPTFDRVAFRVVGSVATAVEGAAAEARRRGYAVRRAGCAVEGEARNVGRRLAEIGLRMAGRAGRSGTPTAVVAGGETTVTVRGGGNGGPNQEVALAAGLELQGVEGVLVASLGTDGVDGPTDAAGGAATGGSSLRARSAGGDPRQALEDNDARGALEGAGDLLVTGATGTNVMDVQLVLAIPSTPTKPDHPTLT